MPAEIYVMTSSEDEHPIEAAVSSGREKRKRARADKTEEAQDIPGLQSEEAEQPALLGTGIVVVDSDQVALPQQRRGSRYFDDGFMESLSCHRCGQPGHKARDCTAAAPKQACPLCAGFGHSKRDCPNTLCFKCQRPGHMARDCPNKGTVLEERGQAVCLRCGRADCPAAGAPDFRRRWPEIRAEGCSVCRADGACTNGYSAADLSRVRCCVCYQRGHLCCQPMPHSDAPQTCYNCGHKGHAGEECVQTATDAARNERIFGDRPRYSNGSRPTHASSYDGQSSRHSYSPHQQQRHQQQQRNFGSPTGNGWLPSRYLDQQQPQQSWHGRGNAYDRVQYDYRI